MRIAGRTWLGLALGAWWALAACGTSHESGFDKNTNWLRSCERSSECGSDLSCVCGVCTKSCDQDDECAGLGHDAVCDATRPKPGTCGAGGHVTYPARTCSRAIDAGADASGPSMSMPADAALDGGATDAEAARDARQPEPDASRPDREPTSVAGCGDAFVCERAADIRSSVRGLLAGDDGFVYFAEWGSLDEVGNHRQDGAIVRVAKDGAEAEAVFSDLDRPWRLWQNDTFLYWLSGEPGDFGVGRGMQALYEAPRDASMDPRERKTDAFAHVQMSRGIFAWQEPATIDGTVVEQGIRLQLWSPQRSLQTWTDQSIAGAYTIAGIDDQGVYIEDGSLSVVYLSFGGFAPQELVADPPAFLTTVADDALWLIHTGSDNRDWVASLPKAGGDIQNVGSAENYYDPPQPGTNVVWLVTGEPGAARWQLWSMPKAGGTREPVFTWPTDSGRVRDDAPAPVWIADGDDAWVIGSGALIHVRRR
jgi:hypothetical protein